MNCVLFAKMDQVFSKENKTIKKYLKIGKKYWKSQGILSVRKSGNPALLAASWCTSIEPLMQAEVDLKADKEGNTALILAAAGGHVENLEKLLAAELM